MAELSAFVPDVTTIAVGCPGLVAERAILLTAIEFAEMTWFLQEEHDAFDLELGEADYELDAPASSRVVGIVNVRINGVEIKANSIREIAKANPFGEAETGSLPTAYVKMGRGVIRVSPIPDVDGYEVVSARIAFSPSDTASRIHDAYLDHREAIANGAIARLLAYPKREWSDSRAAMDYRRRYCDSVNSVRTKVYTNTMYSRISAVGI